MTSFRIHAILTNFLKVTFKFILTQSAHYCVFWHCLHFHKLFHISKKFQRPHKLSLTNLNLSSLLIFPASSLRITNKSRSILVKQQQKCSGSFISSSLLSANNKKKNILRSKSHNKERETSPTRIDGRQRILSVPGNSRRAASSAAHQEKHCLCATAFFFYLETSQGSSEKENQNNNKCTRISSSWVC